MLGVWVTRSLPAQNTVDLVNLLSMKESAELASPPHTAKWFQGHVCLFGTTKELFVNHLVRGLALDLGQDLSQNEQDILCSV
jgi:hypothetical protein